MPGGFPWACARSVTFCRSPPSAPLAPAADQLREAAFVRASGEAVAESRELFTVTRGAELRRGGGRLLGRLLCPRRAPRLFPYVTNPPAPSNTHQIHRLARTRACRTRRWRLCLNQHGSFGQERGGALLLDPYCYQTHLVNIYSNLETILGYSKYLTSFWKKKTSLENQAPNVKNGLMIFGDNSRWTIYLHGFGPILEVFFFFRVCH